MLAKYLKTLHDSIEKSESGRRLELIDFFISEVTVLLNHFWSCEEFAKTLIKALCRTMDKFKGSASPASLLMWASLVNTENNIVFYVIL